MFSTEEIIDLERKWFKYKIKQKSKLYIFLLSLMLCISFIVYTLFSFKQFGQSAQQTTHKTEKKT